mmetsp:Transcript_37446/g.112282  ORF Transcript_37446/g.112282 Transcript_37446/m.112282 type:complete len:212 (+) Transcript_37446:3275-3910(+)
MAHLRVRPPLGIGPVPVATSRLFEQPSEHQTLETRVQHRSGKLSVQWRRCWIWVIRVNRAGGGVVRRIRRRWTSRRPHRKRKARAPSGRRDVGGTNGTGVGANLRAKGASTLTGQAGLVSGRLPSERVRRFAGAKNRVASETSDGSSHPVRSTTKFERKAVDVVACDVNIQYLETPELRWKILYQIVIAQVDIHLQRLIHNTGQKATSQRS